MFVPQRVHCLKTVSDDMGVYNKKGKQYEVLSHTDDLLVIAAEPNSGVEAIQICIDDRDFIVLLGEEEEED